VARNQYLVLLTRNTAHAFALSLCGRHRNLIEREEILAAADLGLIRGAESFDPSRGNFSTWVYFWVRREVRRLIARELAWRHRVKPIEPEDMRSGDDPHGWSELHELTRGLDPEVVQALEGRLTKRAPGEGDPLPRRLTASQVRRRLSSLRAALIGRPRSTPTDPLTHGRP
jgi:hypothetical protein